VSLTARTPQIPAIHCPAIIARRNGFVKAIGQTVAVAACLYNYPLAPATRPGNFRLLPNLLDPVPSALNGPGVQSKITGEPPATRPSLLSGRRFRYKALTPDCPDQEQQVATSVSFTTPTDPSQIPDREKDVGVGWQSETSQIVNRIHLRRILNGRCEKNCHPFTAPTWLTPYS
jgi:hypothetical protein